jgi:Protein of unknown function (DUF2934)
MPMKRKNEVTAAPRREASGGNGGDLREQIARKAYELFLTRGRQHGHDLEDWLQAERIVLGVRRPVSSPEMRMVGSRPAAAPNRRRMMDS